MGKTIDEMIDFFLFEKGEDIKINGITQRALILDATEKINQYDDKIIHSKFQIHTGDLVEYSGSKYFITSEIDKNTNSFCGRTRKCDYRIAINFNGNVKWFDTIIETKVMDTDTNKYMTLATGEIRVVLQDNFDSRDITLDKRFINTSRAWKVTGIDKATIGLTILFCSLDASGVNDDLVNQIADRWLYETTHTYVLTIGNGSTMSVPLNDISQLNISVTDNGVAMNPLPALTFLSSDSNIVSVDNTGKMMGINPGITTVTCQLTYKSSVKATINITVVENLNHVYTITITGSATVKMGLSQSYVAHFYDNGNEVFDKSATWSLRNQDGTGTLYATLTASTGNGATVKGVTMNKNVILKSVLVGDATVLNEFVIQVKGII